MAPSALLELGDDRELAAVRVADLVVACDAAVVARLDVQVLTELVANADGGATLEHPCAHFALDAVAADGVHPQIFGGDAGLERDVDRAGGDDSAARGLDRHEVRRLNLVGEEGLPSARARVAVEHRELAGAHPD